MNYISQIRSFYDVLTAKPISTGQISLWHALMDKCNRCGWKEWFTVANITLELSSGLSRQGIVKCRNALKQAGLIDFKSNGTKATAYKVITLYSLQESVQVTPTTSNSVQVGVQDGLQASVQVSSTLLNVKQETITATTSAREEELKMLFSFCEQNGFGNTIRAMADKIQMWLGDGLSAELIKHALQEAALNGKSNMNYTQGIINRWQREKLLTVDAVEAAKKKRDADIAARGRAKNKIGANPAAYGNDLDFI